MSTWRSFSTPRAEREATPLTASLADEVRRLGGPDPGLTTVVFAHWAELVGAAVAAHSRPVSLRAGVLVVAVDQPAWATQLTFLAAQVLARISEVSGSSEVTELIVRVEGDFPRQNGRR